MKQWILAAVICSACIDWTRFSGTVKGINLKDSSITIQNKDGDLITIPIDYQVKITERRGELRGIASLELDEKIVLIRRQSAEQKTETFDEMNKPK